MIKSFLKIILFLTSLSAFSQIDLTADFDVIKANGCAPFVAEFIDISSNGNSWNWDFGNGVSSNKQNPTHVYSQPGFYTVSLTVSDSSASDTETKSALIRVYPSPIADFTVNDQTVCSPNESKFTDLSIPISGTITEWFWAFGNGETSDKQNPSALYTEIKDYNVFLKVTDANGCSASLSKSDYIKLDGPEAKFIFDSVVCGIPASVTFLNQSIGNNLEYLWDFGDGTSSTGDVPGNHTYNSFDSTEVTLIISEKETGCADTSSNSIIVGNYEAEFDWDIICGDDEFTINVKNTTNIYNSLEWDFSGESKAYTKNSSHHFLGKGPYEITLKSTIDASCWDTTTIQYNLPIPNINYTADKCSYPFEVSFSNNSLAKTFHSHWEFGDSTSSNQKNPSHIYEIPPEEFLSKLIIEDSFGCTDSAFKYIKAPFPIARFHEVDYEYSGCAPLNLTFKDTSYVLNSTITSVKWDFGDPSSGNNNHSTDTNPNHIFNKPGKYDINYIIFTNDGCSDTTSYDSIIKVGEKPLISSFEQLSSDSICYGGSIKFIESASYASNWIESNYICWAFEEDSNSLLSNSESPPIECPETIQSSNKNKAFINFSEPTHYYSEFQHISDTNASTVSTGQIVTNSGNLYTHLIIGYNNCLTEVIRPTFVDTTIAVNGYIINDSLELFSDSTTQIGLYQASINYDSIAYSYVYENSINDTLIQIHQEDSTFHEFKEGNTYKIRTKVVNQISGCSNEITDIFPIDSLRLDFNMPNQKCLNQNPVLFIDHSFSKFGQLKSRKWLINNNVVSNQKDNNPIDSFYFSFPDTGLFKVTLELTYSLRYKKYGKWKTGYYTKSLSKKISIEGAKAIGIADTLQICSGSEIQFSNLSQSTNKIKEYKWIFGDKSDSSIVENPKHEYVNIGSFIPSLLVTDSFGCIDSTSLIEIQVFKPIVEFQVSDTVICEGDIISIENKSIGNALSFKWTIDSLNQFSRSIMQQFDFPGFYDVKLHAIDTFNCSDSLIQRNYIEVSEIPKAEFTADILNQNCPPLISNFSDTTKNAIEGWFWDFGDGNSRTDKNPTHIFTNPGIYDVSLIVTNYANCRDTIKKIEYIEVGGPYGNVSLSKDTLCIPEPVTFNLNLNKTKYFVMEYGDKNKVSYKYADNPDKIDYTYQEGGIYKPQIELIDSLGCIFKIAEIGEIHGDSIKADFKLTSNIICDLNNIKFQNNSKSTLKSEYKWLFGNSDSSIVTSPIYSYSKDSTYEVTLQQMSPLGCEDSVKKSIKIFKSPQPILSIKNKNYCIPSKTTLQLAFKNDKFDSDRISFLINDTLEIDGSFITNTFTKNGKQKINYIIQYGNKNCILDSTIELSFYDWPIADFEYAPSNVSLEESVVIFSDKSKNTTQWSWNFGDLESSEEQNPGHSYEMEDIYNIELTASNEGGCFDSVRKEISISPYDFVKLPSGFSPNNDGQNETFRILRAGNIELIEFKIFNRWGNLVFKTTDIEDAWDGKRQGKDQNAGTYIYYVKGQKKNGEIIEIKGNLSLLR